MLVPADCRPLHNMLLLCAWLHLSNVCLCFVLQLRLAQLGSVDLQGHLSMHTALLTLSNVLPPTHRKTICIFVVMQLRMAQLGGVDLQGHLSKFNPDAAEQGIFTQDWELRYFVLSGMSSCSAICCHFHAD